MRAIGNHAGASDTDVAWSAWVDPVTGHDSLFSTVDSEQPGAGDSCVGTDWSAVADQRLSRLVELEHDAFLMRERLSLLQVDYRQLLLVGEAQLQRLFEINKSRMLLARQLHELEREHAAAQAALLGSRSWHLTRPLRAMAERARSARRGTGNLLRTMLRVRLLRGIARRLVRLVPGLHQRMRSGLYPHG